MFYVILFENYNFLKTPDFFDKVCKDLLLPVQIFTRLL